MDGGTWCLHSPVSMSCSIFFLWYYPQIKCSFPPKFREAKVPSSLLNSHVKCTFTSQAWLRNSRGQEWEPSLSVGPRLPQKWAYRGLRCLSVGLWDCDIFEFRTKSNSSLMPRACHTLSLYMGVGWGFALSVKPVRWFTKLCPSIERSRCPLRVPVSILPFNVTKKQQDQIPTWLVHHLTLTVDDFLN